MDPTQLSGQEAGQPKPKPEGLCWPQPPPRPRRPLPPTPPAPRASAYLALGAAGKGSGRLLSHSRPRRGGTAPLTSSTHPNDPGSLMPSRPPSPLSPNTQSPPTLLQRWTAHRLAWISRVPDWGLCPHPKLPPAFFPCSGDHREEPTRTPSLLPSPIKSCTGTA